MRLQKINFFQIAFALISSWAFAILACLLRILFTGLDTYVAILISALFSISVGLVSYRFAKWNGKSLSSRLLALEIVLFCSAGVLFLSWMQTRDQLKLFFKPSKVPNGLQVIEGSHLLFSSRVHFKAKPEDIASAIKAKELVEIRDGEDAPNQIDKQRSANSHDWWQPAKMDHPRFFFRSHQSQAPQGWHEGWWVNGATNEVYAEGGG